VASEEKDMPVYHYDELEAVQIDENTTRRLAHTEHEMMIVVDFANGPTEPAPHHSHPHEQISYVAQGPVNFYLGQGPQQNVVRVETGDMIVVPPNLPHTVEPLGESTRLVDSFYPLREDFL
jgi:quercetin dioxygenase-like cupin family protein